MAEMNFNQGLAKLTETKVTPAKQPESSNAGPAAAWRRIVDAQASEQRGGEATAVPFHTPRGTESAHQAWLRAIKPAA
jgi:hypothetical protein